MARYVSLIRFTEKGVREIKKSAQRALAFDAAAEKAGVHKPCNSSTTKTSWKA